MDAIWEPRAAPPRRPQFLSLVALCVLACDGKPAPRREVTHVRRFELSVVEEVGGVIPDAADGALPPAESGVTWLVGDGRAPERRGGSRACCFPDPFPEPEPQRARIRRVRIILDERTSTQCDAERRNE